MTLIPNRSKLSTPLRWTFACRLFLIAASLCPAGVFAETSGPESKTAPDREERWYVVMMQDPRTEQYQQCGYMHTSIRREDDEVRTQMKMKIGIRRGDVSIEIVQDQNYRETPDGKPLSFQFVSSLGKDPETLKGEIKDGRIHLIAEQYGQVKERLAYDFDPDIRFPWGQSLLQKSKGLKPDTSYVIKSYEPAYRKDGPLEVQCRVIGRSRQDVLGEKRDLTQVASVMNLGGLAVAGAPAGAVPANMAVESDTWVDDDFTPVLMTMNVGFMKMKMHETTREDAMKRGAPPEMFFETFVPTQREVGRGAKKVVLRFRLKDGAPGPLPEPPATPMQSCKRINDREMEITIRRNDWDAARKAAKPDSIDELLRPFLAPSHVCDAADSRIRRLAKRASRGASTPAEIAAALREKVTEYITNKNMDVGFATASDVARNRSGDCTEHAVLLAAMCRAAGLPARGVSGIIEVPSGYIHDKKGSAFGYHMWTQVYIGGKWIDIDAAMRQTDCEPNRVALTIMPLGDEGLANAVASLMPVLGRIEIEVMSVEK
ncbi:MAG: transglutaminase domain-containing protein [Phycisphaerae bacterium]|nr:transglutaminase domain-containing protein [Phycisphaerae bacterium]